jgi:hypothetical protein
MSPVPAPVACPRFHVRLWAVLGSVAIGLAVEAFVWKWGCRTIPFLVSIDLTFCACQQWACSLVVALDPTLAALLCSGRHLCPPILVDVLVRLLSAGPWRSWHRPCRLSGPRRRHGTCLVGLCWSVHMYELAPTTSHTRASIHELQAYLLAPSWCGHVRWLWAPWWWCGCLWCCPCGV